MTFYSQSNPKWGDQTYYGNNKFKYSGCFVTALSCMIDKEPPETASMLRLNGCFTPEGCLVSECASKALKIEYSGSSKNQPSYPCVFETDHYKSSGYPQHFGIIFPNGEIYDPLLDHGPTVNNYHIVSYRLFIKESEEQMNLHELFAEAIRYVRTHCLGELDEKGSEADIKRIDDNLGDKYVLKNTLQDIMTSKQARNMWVKKDATQVACAKQCATQVASATKELRKTNDELEGDLDTVLKDNSRLIKKINDLEDKLALNVKTEKIVFESAIINWIKKLLGR